MIEQKAFFELKVLEELSSRKRPSMLRALEALVAPDPNTRKSGLNKLIALDAHRRSPLAAAILATRVREPDLDLRMAIVDALVKVIKVGPEEGRPSDDVLLWVRNNLSAMRTREIYALLQVVVRSAKHRQQVCTLLKACSFSGDTLIRILKDRNVDVPIRIAAVEVISEVGFLDAKAALNDLYQRIAGRQAGQIQMAFASRFEREVEQLLPALQDALYMLEEASD
jgi:HEAT repeat protein